MRQQLEDAKRREKRDLQLIQDLEQEVRHSLKRRSEVDLASIDRSGTPMAAFPDTMTTNNISDQARLFADSAESSPTLQAPDRVADISMGVWNGSSMSLGDSWGKQ